MPRIKKQGLDYFPVNTDFIHDRLVRRIMKREGDASLSILIEVLSYIYAGEGYYVQADSLFYEDLSSNLYEKNSEDVQRIVALAVEYGVFDAGLFHEFGILTSANIQRQYVFSTKRRSVSLLNPAYNLIGEEFASQSAKTNQSGKRKKGVNEMVNSVNGWSVETCVKPDEQVDGEELDANVKRTKCVTIIPENVTSGTYSIAQHSIAQHSVAENRIDSPSPASPEAGKEESLKRGRENEEEIFSGTNRRVGKDAETEKGKIAGKHTEKRREWTNEAIDQLLPPSDGLERNYDGLIYNMRNYGIPPSEQYVIIRKSNFGVIGNPVWKGFCTLRDSGGKIKLPGRYLLSVLNR